MDSPSPVRTPKFPTRRHSTIGFMYETTGISVFSTTNSLKELKKKTKPKPNSSQQAKTLYDPSHERNRRIKPRILSCSWINPPRRPPNRVPWPQVDQVHAAGSGSRVGRGRQRQRPASLRELRGARREHVGGGPPRPATGLREVCGVRGEHEVGGHNRCAWWVKTSI